MQGRDDAGSTKPDAAPQAPPPEPASPSLFSNLLAELETTIQPEPVDRAETGQALDCAAALESIGHLQKKVESLWGSPDLNVFITRLFVDSRDGVRKGLPLAVADELVWLGSMNKMARAMDAAGRLKLSLREAYRLVEEGDQARLDLTPPSQAGNQTLVFASRREQAPPGLLDSLRTIAGSLFVLATLLVIAGAVLYWLEPLRALFR